MKRVMLRNKSPLGHNITATFVPDCGMNLISYRHNEIEVIDQNTLPLFEERFAGLGALIGPHFHHRAPSQITPIKNPELFPHIAKVQAKGVADFFSHGIARYVPWQYENTDTAIFATLKGSDQYKGVSLAELEGMDFEMSYKAILHTDGLNISLSVKGSCPCMAGMHYYYRLQGQEGVVVSQVQRKVRHSDGWAPLPVEWLQGSSLLQFSLDQAADFGFQTDSDNDQADILFQTSDYGLHLHIRNDSADCSWQLFHPKDGTFVCIEPLTSSTPYQPTRQQSSLKVKIAIVTSSDAKQQIDHLLSSSQN